MRNASPERPLSRRVALLISGGLVLVVAALYAQTWRHGFLSYDDSAYITENPYVRDGLGLRGLRWALLEFHAANWHPLTWLSHQLDVELFGLAPGPHHLVNAGLHALNAVLCFLFLRSATRSTWPSALVALLFAVHPQRVESVAWAAERKDVLAGVFFFLTLLAWLRYARAPSAARYGLVCLAFVLGLLAKPMLVTLPAVLLLLDLWPLRRWSFGAAAPAARAPWRTLLLEKVPLVALAVASALVTIRAQREGDALSSLEVFSLPERVATAVLGTVAYLRDFAWPAGLAFFYPHPALVAGGEFRPFEAIVLLAGLVLAVLTYGAWRVRRQRPVFLVGWAWLLVMLLPVLGLVQVGTQLYADRYAYLPTLGLALALVFGADELVNVTVRRVLFGLGVLWCAGLAAVTYRQVGYWKDGRTLCEHAIAVTAGNYVALEHLALQLQQQGELELARQRYEETLAIAPRLYDAHSNLGTVLMQLGQRERAVAEYGAALRLKPGYLHARLNWGMLYELDGDHARALEQYQLAVEEHPDAPAALTKLGDALLALGRAPEARDVYLRSLARPGLGLQANTHCGLAEALTVTGDEPAALEHFRQALAVRPDLVRALHGQAWILATSPAAERRDPARALEQLARCGASAEGKTWQHLRVAAATLAALGRFPEAARSATEAGTRAPESARAELESERALYAAGQALIRRK